MLSYRYYGFIDSVYALLDMGVYLCGAMEKQIRYPGY
jgi:hypothetical protein